MSQESRSKELADGLIEHIGGFQATVTGFSAGVDSTVVAVAAARALGNQALAVTAVTETLTAEDRQLARSIASSTGLNYREVHYRELEIEGYAENPANRCYYCKDALYGQLRAIARDIEGAVLLDGTNADDRGDYRPGREAAGDHAVCSPLLDLEIGKEEVRQIARHFGLPNAEKPSAPCLSSRVPYGTTITPEILDQVGNAERVLRELGFSEFRVRHHNDVARLELRPDDFSRAVELASTIEESLVGLGYRYVALDLGGFRSGSLNRALTQISLPSNGQ